MRIHFAVVCSFLLLGFSAAASASTFETFDINASILGGGDITGNLTFDTATDQFTGSDIVTPYGSITGAETSQGLNGASVDFAFGVFGQGLYMVFNVPGSTLAGYAGGAICSQSAPCGDSTSILIGGSYGLVDSGTLTLDTGAAATPEPSSLILLGSGLIGMAAAARRRLARG